MKTSLHFFLRIFTLSCFIFWGSLSSSYAQMRVGQPTGSPDGSAALDVSGGPYNSGSPYRGLLPPKVALSQTGLAAPVTAPATGLLVYNMAKVGDVTPGYYYWEGNKWVRLSTANTGAARVAAAGGGQYIPAFTLSEVRSLTYTPNNFMLIELGREGFFSYDINDTTTPDNDGTVLVTTATSNPNKRYKRRFSGSVDVRWFGAKGDGVTDDTQAIQNAINAVSRVVNTRHVENGVYIPTGNYLITDILDVTNTRTSSTSGRDGIRIFGDGMGYTYLLGRTGAGKAIIDVSGSQWLTLSDMTLQTFSNSPTPSTIGIYSGLLTILQQTQNQLFSRIAVFMHNDPAANGGNGTVAYYNFGSEENTHNAIFYTANRPVVLTGSNLNPMTYSYSKWPLWPSPHSLGVTTFTGECFLQALDSKFPAIETVDVNSIHADNLYINGSGTAPTQNQAIRIQGGCNNADLRGTIEGFSGIAQIYGRLESSTLNFTLGNSADYTKPIFRLEQGAEGRILSSSIRAFITEGSGRPFWQVTTTAPEQITTCYVKDTDVKTNLPLSSLMLPAKILWSSYTNSVQLFSSDAPVYRIDANRHTIAIGPKQIRGYNASPDSAIIAKVKLPDIRTGTSAHSITIHVEGIGGHSSPQSNATSSIQWQGTLPIVVNFNGGVIIGTPTTTVVGHTENVPNGNTLNGINIKGVLKNNVIEIVLKANVSGVNNELVNFSGQITMSFMGNTSDAPSLSLN